MNAHNHTRRDFLKTSAAWTAAFTACSCAAASSSSAGGRLRPPNIIFILCDDLGWAEPGCYGNTFNETPNVDKLAAGGMRFTDAYAAAPVCSPTRAALLTGQYPARVGITDYLRPGAAKHLSTDHITITEMLKKAGYATGIIGKWHLSGYASAGAEESPPGEHGFDEIIVSENHGIGGGSYFHPYHFNPQIRKRLPGREYLVDRVNLEAVEFIERHKNEPFFLYLSHYAVHTRLAGKPELVAKYRRKPGSGKDRRAARNNPHLAAMLESIDQGVGMIMRKLAALDLTGNTIVVFTSDNGGERRVTSNGPLRAGKSTLYEGGIRVPLVFHWPKLVPHNTVCRQPVNTIDFYPTFLEAAGIRPDPRQHLDGVSLIPILKNPKHKLKRRALYWHYPLRRPHFLGGRSSGAIRCGDWKLIEFFDTGKLELYNLARDPAERNNLADEASGKAAQLQKLLAAWRRQVGAWIPADPKRGRR